MRSLKVSVVQAIVYCRLRFSRLAQEVVFSSRRRAPRYPSLRTQTKRTRGQALIQFPFVMRRTASRPLEQRLQELLKLTGKSNTQSWLNSINGADNHHALPY